MLEALLLISSLILVNNYEIINMDFPRHSSYPFSYVLLDRNVVLVTNDTIYFLSSTMNLNESKTIPLQNKITSIEEYGNSTISQFPESQGGYIMILCNKIIYFFYHNATFINFQDLSSDLSNRKNFSLIPFKYENNYLHYLISYPINMTAFGFVYFKYNILNYSNVNIKQPEFKADIQNQIDNYVLHDLPTVKCLFMSNFSDSDLLVCFYALRYRFEVQIRFFEPNNNFIEKEENFIYCDPCWSDGNLDNLFFDVVTDKERKVAYIFMMENQLYYMKFNISNIFGSNYECEGIFQITKISNFVFINSMVYNKIFYFRQTNEYIFAAQLYNEYQIYIVHFNFNSSLNIQNNEIIQTEGYHTATIFSLMILDENYIIVKDGKYYPNDGKIFFFNITEMGMIKFVEDPITVFSESNNEFPNIIQITNPKIIPTTVPSTLKTTWTTTILTTIPTSIQTTILTALSTIILSTIPSTILSTIPSTIPSSILSSLPLTSTITTIQSTNIISLTNTLIIPTTVLTIPTSLLIEKQINNSTVIPTIISRTIPTTVLTPKTSNILSSQIIPISTEINITETKGKQESDKINILTSELTQFQDSNNIYSESTILIPETTFSTVNTLKVINTIPTNQIPNLNNVIVHEEKINITKENLMQNLTSLIEDIEIGQIHKKVGEDFTVLIYPTNSTFLANETHVDFSECEQVLRSH